jgi:hypothetical protein
VSLSENTGFLVRTYYEGDEIIIGDVRIIYKANNVLAIKAPKDKKIEIIKIKKAKKLSYNNAFSQDNE